VILSFTGTYPMLKNSQFSDMHDLKSPFLELVLKDAPHNG